MENFIITKDFVKKVKRFNLTGRTIEFKIKPVPGDVEPVRWVREAVNQVIQKGTEGLAAGDRVGFNFCSKDFKRGDGWVRFRPVEEITYDDIWNVISNVYQSNSVGMNTETFCLGVTTVKMPAGKGSDRNRGYNTFQEECAKRRGIISIKNTDNMCLPRALVVAIAYVNKDPERIHVRKDTRKLQTQRAIRLVQEAGVIIPQEGCGIPELQKFQEHFKNYKIVVYRYGSKGRDTIFQGAAEGPTLNLLYHDTHYCVIVSLTAAFCCVYYCEGCHIPYNVKDKHRCGGTCPCCRETPACLQTIQIKCDVCKRSFRGQACYDNHIKNAICKKIRRCDECYRTVQRERQHTCGEVFCKICNTHVPQDHLCYMRPDTGKPKTEDLLFIFYDLETRQEKMMEDGSFLHEPNLCVLASRCNICVGENKLHFCQKCGYRIIVYRDNVIENFMEHLLNVRKKFKQVVVIAHNGQSFDHQFILHYILTKTDLKPEPIMRGSKIISMTVGNMKFLDSLNYFPMALAKLPKAFGLGDDFKKGYFPHLFNTEANAAYIGALPSLNYYDADALKTEEREKFLAWYEEHKEDTFDMQRDIVNYCISDVEILTAACLKFRQQMLETSNICPFTEACTIASTCNKVFRRNFLKPNTIGIIPKGGYRCRDNQSRIAIQWMLSEERNRRINIIHAAKGLESKLYGVKVDGFCSDTNQVFEFHGCYYHGCPSCFKYGRDQPLHDDPSQTLDSLYEATIAKTERLRDLGYEVEEMWECRFRRALKEDEELYTYTGKHPLLTVTPLNPRYAFYGGRTGNTYEYYKCQPGEKIKYVDVCSLYPWVCKYGKFPIGHPKVYVGNECPKNLHAVEGVIHCKILPPQDLYHPVLPTKMNDKLMFVLCHSCGEQMNRGECTHTHQERALTGTWVIDEVMKALDKGYKMLEIYEVWEYEVEQFDKATKLGGLFRDMMDRFVKVKQKSSGWPKNCTTEEQRERYIREFLEREDIRLEYSEIVENPGLRSLAKLILNSFWGKFGQRENQPKTAIVRTPTEFLGMLSNPGIYVNSALPINEDTLIVNWEHREEAYGQLSSVNVILAAYVTAQARLKLYGYLERLGIRALYYDTDSVIYVSRDGEYDVPTGEFLGDMTDELESYGLGSYITEFVSGGPKNYAYKIFSTKSQREEIVCKVKGISLNYTNSQILNFEAIKEMVLTPTEPIYIITNNIRRTKEHEVVTRSETKIYRPNSSKRKFIENYSSQPFGYKVFKKH